jgi:sugar lactone lactonase YvrE
MALATAGVTGSPAPAGAAGTSTVIYVGDATSDIVLTYRVPATSQNLKPTSDLHLAVHNSATGLALDSRGDLWVAATTSSGVVAEYSPEQLAAGGTQTPVTTLTLGTNVGDLAFDGAGDLWMTEGFVGDIVELTPAQLAHGGSPVPAVTLSTMKITGHTPAEQGIAFDPAGDLWVTSNASNDNYLMEFTPAQLSASGSPKPHVVIKPTTSKELGAPVDLAFTAAGDLWVTDYTTNSTTLVEYTPAQLGASGAPSPTVKIKKPGPLWGAAFDSAGNLWTTAPTAAAVLGFTPSQLAGGGTTPPTYEVHGATTQMAFPEGLSAAALPTVTSVTPPSAQPGATVTVHGSGFTSSTVVAFGSAAATTVTDVSPFTLTAKVPPGSGTVTVIASTWVGSSATSSADHFAYAQTGYDLVGSDGGVFVFDAPGQTGGFFGSLPGIHVTPAAPIVGLVPTLTDQGYFLVGDDGGVFAFGTAPFLGSLPGKGVVPSAPIVGIVAADTDKGYFLVGRDGGVFAFGNVPFLGSLPGRGVSVDNVIGIAATPSGNGYWVVTSTGTVYAFGAAKQLGTAKGTTSPVAAIAGTPTGGGYWITTQNGTVKPFGNAKGFGTLPALKVTPALPVIGIVHTSGTAGYWLIGSDGGIFAFGDAGFVGSLPGVGVHVTNIVGAVPN